MQRRQLRRVLTALATSVLASASLAIEAPATAPAAEPRPAITPNDEAAFYQQLQQVTHRRNLREFNVADAVVQALAAAEVDQAVALLGKAALTDPLANIALVRVQNWCGRLTSARIPDPQPQIARLPAELGAAGAARAAGVLIAESDYLTRARVACSRAQFDYQGIEARLRAAADAGHPASTTELAQFTRDAAKRSALLQVAIDKNYPPAAYALATSRLIAVQRGETTENVGSIRELLKQAGRTVSKAKLDLANCMALGCDGHPADAATAAAFGLDAARDGEPAAFLSMVRMPWGIRMPRTQVLAWQFFGNRLNEAGCLGDGYVTHAVTFAQTIQALTRGQDTALLEQAAQQMETLWRDFGARARKYQGCD